MGRFARNLTNQFKSYKSIQIIHVSFLRNSNYHPSCYTHGLTPVPMMYRPCRGWGIAYYVMYFNGSPWGIKNQTVDLETCHTAVM